jgi:hypothetical protein
MHRLLTFRRISNLHSGYLVSLSALLAALPLRVKRTRGGRIVLGCDCLEE